MRKRWSELTELEINKLKENQCIECRWFSTGTSGYKGSSTCEYGAFHYHSRGCDPRDCVNKGFFEPIIGKKKRRITTWRSKTQN